jgi:uncharacterized membrane protein SirB2
MFITRKTLDVICAILHHRWLRDPQHVDDSGIALAAKKWARLAPHIIDTVLLCSTIWQSQRAIVVYISELSFLTRICYGGSHSRQGFEAKAVEFKIAGAEIYKKA